MSSPNESDHGGGAASYIRYTIEELMSLGKLPLSRKRPDFYDDPPPSGNTVRIPWRLRTENNRAEEEKRQRIAQKIVLSPQGRTLNMGSHMPPPSTEKIPTLLPNLTRDRDRMHDRRIGSGRIITRDVSWDYNGPAKPSNGADSAIISFRNGSSSNPPPREGSLNRDDWSDRRPMRNSGSMFDNHKGRGPMRRGYREEAEPEWFSSGPTSQFDTIELHGFDDVNTSNDDLATEVIPPAPTEKESKVTETPKVSSSTPVKSAQPPVNDTNNNAQKKDVAAPATEFNFERYLQLDPESHFNSVSSSRFSQWFTKRTPSTTPSAPPGDDYNGGRSSIFADLENIMNDSQSANVPDGNSNKYSAPPVPPMVGPPRGEVSQSVMNFLQTVNMGGGGGGGGGGGVGGGGIVGIGMPPTGFVPPQVVKQQRPTKILNVKELEANMRDCALTPKALPNQPSMPKDKVEMDAFRKFVANMNNEQLMATKRPMPIPEDKNKPKLYNFTVRGGGGRPTVAAYMELLQKAIFYGAMQSNRRELLSTPEAQDLLQALLRGELSTYTLLRRLQAAQSFREQEICIAVLWAFDQSTRSAEMPASQMYQQAAPRPWVQPPFTRNMPPMGDGMAGQMGGFPQMPPSMPPSMPPNMPPSMPPSMPPAMPPAQAVVPPGGPKNLSVSSLPNGMPQRIPSPRELQFHTQSIMQNALIRKKLGEQLENYMKRQENAQQQPPMPQQNQQQQPQDLGQAPPGRRIKPQHQIGTSTSLSFTPTSVLCKMAADKEMETPQAKSASETSTI
ncbi:hypothetical protein DMENIID0001_152720 [Sergentomyia squamirostris]